MRVHLTCGTWHVTAEVKPAEGTFAVRLLDRELVVRLREFGPGAGVAEVDGKVVRFFYTQHDQALYLHAFGRSYVWSRGAETQVLHIAEESNVRAPMSGVVTRVLVEPGQRVASGQALYVLEAMKMETVVRAPRLARIRRVLVRAGEQVEGGAVVVELEDEL